MKYIVLFLFIGTVIVHLASGGNFPQAAFANEGKERYNLDPKGARSTVSLSARLRDHQKEAYTISRATLPVGSSVIFHHLEGPEDSMPLLPLLLVPQSSLLSLDEEGRPIQVQQGGVDPQLDDQFRQFLMQDDVRIAFKQSGNQAVLEMWTADEAGNPVHLEGASGNINWVQAKLQFDDSANKWKLTFLRGLSV